MACAPSENTDQPGHPPSLVRVFAIRMKKAWVLSYPLSAQWRLWSDWADAQADLSLRWAHSHFVGFVMSRLTLGKINLAIVFVCVRSIISGFYCHFIESKYKCRSPKKDFLVKTIRMIICNVCTSVTSVLKTSWRKGHFWWYAEAKNIV